MFACLFRAPLVKEPVASNLSIWIEAPEAQVKCIIQPKRKIPETAEDFPSGAPAENTLDHSKSMLGGNIAEEQDRIIDESQCIDLQKTAEARATSHVDVSQLGLLKLKYRQQSIRVEMIQSPQSGDSVSAQSLLGENLQQSIKPRRATEAEMIAPLISHEARRRRRIETQGDGQGEDQGFNPLIESTQSWTLRLVLENSDSLKISPTSRVPPPSQVTSQASLFSLSRASVN